MRWSGKKYVRRYHKSLTIAKDLDKIVTGENYVWYSVRALHVMLLVLLFGQNVPIGHATGLADPSGQKEPSVQSFAYTEPSGQNVLETVISNIT